MVVTWCPRCSHPVPLLKFLHWLPVQSHIIFKLRTIAYQALLENLHICFPCFLYHPSTESSILLVFTCYLFLWLKLILAFSVAVPTLWNSLSEHVKSSNSIVSFHHHLKIHLFRLTYPSWVSFPSNDSFLGYWCNRSFVIIIITCKY